MVHAGKLNIITTSGSEGTGNKQLDAIWGESIVSSGGSKFGLLIKSEA